MDLAPASSLFFSFLFYFIPMFTQRYEEVRSRVEFGDGWKGEKMKETMSMHIINPENNSRSIELIIDTLH